jgi:putative ABC transport system ATP-binding protein
MDEALPVAEAIAISGEMITAVGTNTVILADEPTGNLDSKTGVEILELLRGAVSDDRTVVLVTHDPRIAEQGERVLTMADGRLVRDERGAGRGEPE